MTYAQLRESLLVFGIGERATLREIRERHRELVRRYHPDCGVQEEPKQIRRVNAAYRVLRDYVESYRFSFSEEEFYEQNAEERIRMQFMSDSIWGTS
ncbi:MAG: J domain-containing protein [Geobacteraceae bacterium]|nr:J domain-containing protein [Geobacteraceae bacterium]